MSIRLWLVVSLTCATLAATGCDEDQSPRDKCRVLVRDFCEAVVDCGLAAESQLRECRRDVEENAECADAVTVERGYETCLDDIATIECSALPDLPSSCEGVIGVR